MKKGFAFVALLAFCLVLFLLPADSSAGRRAGRWELLGERTVTDAVDHDTIPVTAARGTFRALKIMVEERAVQFRDVKIHFADGSVQDVTIRKAIPAGGESRKIDIRGRDRVVRSVEFWYDAQSIGGKRATVRVYGQN
ncbi:MAG TPA: hypothetical protein VLT87_16180 [Thermoanaerobaculia bacterium]|nr:hypothetical protein [Thermoanaerobaculia bacterium]HSN89083.1 hypothetical protein [Thermoanaerobaculia bacterium]